MPSFIRGRHRSVEPHGLFSVSRKIRHLRHLFTRHRDPLWTSPCTAGCNRVSARTA